MKRRSCLSNPQVQFAFKVALIHLLALFATSAYVSCGPVHPEGVENNTPPQCPAPPSSPSHSCAVTTPNEGINSAHEQVWNAADVVRAAAEAMQAQATQASPEQQENSQDSTPAAAGLSEGAAVQTSAGQDAVVEAEERRNGYTLIRGTTSESETNLTPVELPDIYDGHSTAPLVSLSQAEAQQLSSCENNMIEAIPRGQEADPRSSSRPTHYDAQSQYNQHRGRINHIGGRGGRGARIYDSRPSLDEAAVPIKPHSYNNHPDASTQQRTWGPRRVGGAYIVDRQVPLHPQQLHPQEFSGQYTQQQPQLQLQQEKQPAWWPMQQQPHLQPQHQQQHQAQEQPHEQQQHQSQQQPQQEQSQLQLQQALQLQQQSYLQSHIKPHYISHQLWQQYLQHYGRCGGIPRQELPQFLIHGHRTYIANNRGVWSKIIASGYYQQSHLPNGYFMPNTPGYMFPPPPPPPQRDSARNSGPTDVPDGESRPLSPDEIQLVIEQPMLTNQQHRPQQQEQQQAQPNQQPEETKEAGVNQQSQQTEQTEEQNNQQQNYNGRTHGEQHHEQRYRQGWQPQRGGHQSYAQQRANLQRQQQYLLAQSRYLEEQHFQLEEQWQAYRERQSSRAQKERQEKGKDREEKSHPNKPGAGEEAIREELMQQQAHLEQQWQHLRQEQAYLEQQQAHLERPSLRNMGLPYNHRRWQRPRVSDGEQRDLQQQQQYLEQQLRFLQEQQEYLNHQQGKWQHPRFVQERIVYLEQQHRYLGKLQRRQQLHSSIISSGGNPNDVNGNHRHVVPAWVPDPTPMGFYDSTGLWIPYGMEDYHKQQLEQARDKIQEEREALQAELDRREQQGDPRYFAGKNGRRHGGSPYHPPGNMHHYPHRDALHITGQGGRAADRHTPHFPQIPRGMGTQHGYRGGPQLSRAPCNANGVPLHIFRDDVEYARAVWRRMSGKLRHQLFLMKEQRKRKERQLAQRRQQPHDEQQQQQSENLPENHQEKEELEPSTQSQAQETHVNTSALRPQEYHDENLMRPVINLEETAAPSQSAGIPRESDNATGLEGLPFLDSSTLSYRTPREQHGGSAPSNADPRTIAALAENSRVPAALEDLYEALRSCDPRLQAPEEEAAAWAPREQHGISAMEMLLRRAMLRYLGEGRWTNYEGFVTSQAAALRLNEDEIHYMHLGFYLDIFNQHATQHVADMLREHRGRARGFNNRRNASRQGLCVNPENGRECSNAREDLQDRLRLVQILQDRYRTQIEHRIEEARATLLRPRQVSQPRTRARGSAFNAGQNPSSHPQRNQGRTAPQNSTNESLDSTRPQDASSHPEPNAADAAGVETIRENRVSEEAQADDSTTTNCQSAICRNHRRPSA
ncbi:hypothetical protein, conserved [Eimeria maxima]|uniref:Uncharacterized protein n=1 Tax=Eimeria maxima TaxID=5804 RepID=U6MBM4_EIMMA|nr:hypothetical protein, conserved [Eimeria maxima]CDJ59035.1 hypothetical protein, conserved [Eimeria maxima]